MSDITRTPQIYNAMDIANYIINYVHGKRRVINNLKLQKILYFVQAQFLITYERPCFSDPILAWDAGPIVKSVYDEYKIFGSATIPDVSLKPVTVTIHPKDAALINDVVDMCNQYTQTTLLHLIHRQMPWKRGHNRTTNHITNEDLYAFFSE